MLAFLATAPPPVFVPKPKTGNLTSEFRLLKSCPTPKNVPQPWHVLSVNILVAVTSRYNWALRSLNSTPGESISLKHQDFLKRYFYQRTAFNIWSKQSTYLAAALWPTKSLVYTFHPKVMVRQNSFMIYLIFHACLTKAEGKRSIYILVKTNWCIL